MNVTMKREEEKQPCQFVRLLLINGHIYGMPGTILLACGTASFCFHQLVLMALHPLVHSSVTCSLTGCCYTLPPLSRYAI